MTGLTKDDILAWLHRIRYFEEGHLTLEMNRKDFLALNCSWDVSIDYALESEKSSQFLRSLVESIGPSDLLSMADALKQNSLHGAAVILT